MSLPQLVQLSDKVALVTGASSGIGAATAILFSQLEARMAITGLLSNDLDSVASECREPGDVFRRTCDLTDDDECKKLVADVVERFGRLDILVNSAGILLYGSLESTTPEEYNQVFDINVKSTFRLSQLAIPHLVSSRGCIVNVSSVNGFRSFSGVISYNMSKAAVDHLTRSSSLELAPKGVRVNAVNPGVIVTEIYRRAGLDESAVAAFLERTKSTHPLGRAGRPLEVARVIAFLASGAAGFITGVTLPVDGGRHATCLR